MVKAATSGVRTQATNISGSAEEKQENVFRTTSSDKHYNSPALYSKKKNVICCNATLHNVMFISSSRCLL